MEWSMLQIPALQGIGETPSPTELMILLWRCEHDNEGEADDPQADCGEQQAEAEGLEGREEVSMSRAKIISVRCDSQSGIIKRWTVVFSNGKEEVYDGEIPPAYAFRFCMRAKYGFKSIDGDSMIDLYSMKRIERSDPA